MANYADALIAFWDGKSKGTLNMIDKANSFDLRLIIVFFQNQLEQSYCFFYHKIDWKSALLKY